MEKLIVLLMMSLMFVGCEDNSFHEGKFFAGGKYVEASTLNKGKQIYAEYCMACHGVNGDGKGVAAKGLKVPPRNFQQGIYKFGHVVSGELPHDEDFFKLLHEGLNGTAMLPWDLTRGQMDAVVQYIKTFAPKAWEGKDKKLGERILPSKDPYGLAHRTTAIEKGKEVYHVQAQCWTCHRAYVPYQELQTLTKNATGDDADEFDPEIYKIKLQGNDYGYQSVPPEFTWNSVRSAQTVEDLYVRLAAGVGGTTMPSWKDTITDEEIWAVAYYVRSLMDLKDSPKRAEFMENISK